MLAVADMHETILFYCNILGFSIQMQSDDYSIISRDGSTIHLMKAATEEVLRCVRGHAEIYLEVNEISHLWRHVEPFKDQYKIKGLIEQPYGMTEFRIQDPNDCLVFVGQHTKK